MLPPVALRHRHRAAPAGEDVELRLIHVRRARVEGEALPRAGRRIHTIERRDLVGARHVAVEEALGVTRPLAAATDSTDAAKARRPDGRRRHRARGLGRDLDHVARRTLEGRVTRQGVWHEVRRRPDCRRRIQREHLDPALVGAHHEQPLTIRRPHDARRDRVLRADLPRARLAYAVSVEAHAVGCKLRLFTT